MARSQPHGSASSASSNGSASSNLRRPGPLDAWRGAGRARAAGGLRHAARASRDPGRAGGGQATRGGWGLEQLVRNQLQHHTHTHTHTQTQTHTRTHTHTHTDAHTHDRRTHARTHAHTHTHTHTQFEQMIRNQLQLYVQRTLAASLEQARADTHKTNTKK